MRRMCQFLAAAGLLLCACVIVQGEAQTRTITFSGLREGGGAVVPDSIHIVNLTRQRDTLLVGATTFDIDWLTSVAPSDGSVEGFTLGGGTYDPATSKTIVQVVLPTGGSLHMRLFAMTGAKVAEATLALGSGRHGLLIDATGLASGAYLLAATNGADTRVCVLTSLHRSTGGAVRISTTSIPPAAVRKPAIDAYTFIGYARGCHPDTLASIVPEPDRTYAFSFVPLAANQVRVGASHEVARTAITPQGGTVTVSAPGTPVSGLQITVPAASYSDTRTFTVSYAEVLDHSFDARITLLSPLITLSNGGGYADSSMLIRIPIRLPAGHFAMAFFLNRQTEMLEAASIVALTDDAIFITSPHLASDNLSLGKSITPDAPSAAMQAWIDVLVAGIETGELTSTISTDFAPGTDDWEFPNMGSYLAPNGHCTGQSLTGIWYFANKRKRGAAPLWRLYDQVHADSMWMDNVRGWRMNSVVWKPLRVTERNNWVYNYFEHVGTSRISKDSLHYLAFAFAMRTTGRPQLTEIWRRNGLKWEGHAMVVYGTDRGSLRIADPNYPGVQRGTRLDAGTFLPYESGATADELGVLFPDIQYIAFSAITVPGDIEARWKQTYDGTIGTVAPHTYPATQLFLLDDAAQTPLPDHVVTMRDTVVVTATCPTCVSRLAGNRTYVRLTDEQGKFIAWSGPDGRLRIPAPTGTKRFGLAVYGYAEAGFKGFGIIDFRWLDITRTTYKRAQMRVTGLVGTFERDYIDSLGRPVVGEISEGDLSFQAPLNPWGEFTDLVASGGTYTWEKAWSSGGNSADASLSMAFSSDSAVGNVIYSYTRLDDGGSYLTAIMSLVLSGPIPRVARYADRDEFAVTGPVVASRIGMLDYQVTMPPHKKRDVLKSFRAVPASRIDIIMFK